MSRRGLLVALVVVSALLGGCSTSDRAPVNPPVTSKPSAEPRRGDVVATIAETEPGDALRVYLHGWMLRYNERALGEPENSDDATWTPTPPDDFVSVMPAVSMSDFRTVAVWSASIRALGPVSKTEARYDADFMFWRGNPLSSAGTGAVPLSSSATYELSWDEGERAWVITLASESPDQNLVESSDESTGLP